NTPEKSGVFFAMRRESLALDPLRGAACLVAAVFLALDHAAVAGQEACLFQRGAQARLEVHQRAGNPMAYGARLAGQAAARDEADDVELTDAVGGFKSLVDDEALGAARKIL